LSAYGMIASAGWRNDPRIGGRVDSQYDVPATSCLGRRADATISAHLGI